MVHYLSMSESRQALLNTIIDEIAAKGLSDTSLRELAQTVGTSHRMLNYHFGGRAGLVAAVVAENESRQRELLTTLARGADGPTDVVRSQWAILTDPAMTPHIKLFLELLALALHQRPGTEGFLDTVTEPWLDVATEAAATQLGYEPDRIELRLGVAVVRGLLIEALAADDPAPATASLERFLAMWDTWRHQG